MVNTFVKLFFYLESFSPLELHFGYFILHPFWNVRKVDLKLASLVTTLFKKYRTH